MDTAVLTRQKKLEDGVGLNRLRQATDNGAWLPAIPHCLNGTDFSWEEFQENILLLYRIVPLKLPTELDGCGKKFLVPLAFSYQKGVLVLAQHNAAAKEWGYLSARAINPSATFYGSIINSRAVQGERNGDGARVAMGTQDREENEGEDGETGHATVPDEPQVDVSVHGFWKWGTTALFDMQMVNLYAGSYLCQTYVKSLGTAEKEKK